MAQQARWCASCAHHAMHMQMQMQVKMHVCPVAVQQRCCSRNTAVCLELIKYVLEFVCQASTASRLLSIHSPTAVQGYAAKGYASKGKGQR